VGSILLTEVGIWRGVGPSPEKIIFHLKWRVLVNSDRYFLSVPRQKEMLNFPSEVVLW